MNPYEKPVPTNEELQKELDQYAEKERAVAELFFSSFGKTMVETKDNAAVAEVLRERLVHIGRKHRQLLDLIDA